MFLNNVLFIFSILIFFTFSYGDIDEQHDSKFDNLQKSNDEEDEYSYDHHAILGRDDTRIYDKLSPEEGKAKFSEIIDKMDINHDGDVSLQELKDWIKNVFDNILNEDVNAKWKEFNLDDKEKIDFNYYKNKIFGDRKTDDHINAMMKDERRWNVADLDKDFLLNKTEFFRFLHPEQFKDMKPLIALETLEELDTNNDSVVDINEYMNDFFPDGKVVKDDWVRNERQNFGIERDLNKDGVLDQEEIEKWLLPDSYNRVDAEANHFMVMADVDRNQVLSKSEMLNNYKVFVGAKQQYGYESVFQGHEDL